MGSIRGPAFRLYRNIAGYPNFKAAFLSSGSLFGCGPGELAIRSNPCGPGKNHCGRCTYPYPIAGPWAVLVLPALSRSKDEMNTVVPLHQGAASFQKGQRVEDKAICQGGMLILVDCLERQVIKEAFKDGYLFRTIVDER